MKIEDLSLRQVAIGIAVLGFLNWAGLQFAILPGMPEEQRKLIYSGWISTPYPYAASCILILLAFWFVFYYRGRFITPGRRVVAFAIALGTVGGMVLIFVIRTTWHI